jgi:hypothetical protein
MCFETELERRREANAIGEKMRRKKYYVKKSDKRERDVMTDLREGEGRGVNHELESKQGY